MTPLGGMLILLSSSHANNMVLQPGERRCAHWLRLWLHLLLSLLPVMPLKMTAEGCVCMAAAGGGL